MVRSPDGEDLTTKLTCLASVRTAQVQLYKVAKVHARLIGLLRESKELPYRSVADCARALRARLLEVLFAAAWSFDGRSRLRVELAGSGPDEIRLQAIDARDKLLVGLPVHIVVDDEAAAAPPRAPRTPQARLGIMAPLPSDGARIVAAVQSMEEQRER
jgi:hypothetical protein